MNLAQTLKTIFGERFLENEPMSRHTNFRIGGPAKFFVEAQTTEEIAAAIDAARASRTPYFILGGGSNVLVSDAGFDGLVIKLANRDIFIEGETVIAEAGAITAAVARAAANAGLTGFEWGIGIPGTLGGAVCGNAGAWGGEMKDVVSSVETLFCTADGHACERRKYKNDECGFAYRESVFKFMHPQAVAVRVTLALKDGDRNQILKKLEEFLKERKENQPLEHSSAGCVFKNFEFRDEKELKKLRSASDVPERFIKARRIPAGWLVDEADLKGTRIGGATISKKHGNFIVNAGGATSDEVVQLISLVKTRIRSAYNLQLQEEIQYVGFL